jgi:subtilisin family serine protease
MIRLILLLVVLTASPVWAANTNKKLTREEFITKMKEAEKKLGGKEIKKEKVKARAQRGHLIVSIAGLQMPAQSLSQSGKSWDGALIKMKAKDTKPYLTLDQLNAKYGVKNPKPLMDVDFKDKKTSKDVATVSIAKQNFDSNIQTIRNKFPERSKRAPKDYAFPDLTNIYVIDINPALDPEVVAQEYRKNPNVTFAQPDYIHEPQAVTPVDPFYNPSQSIGSWGLRRIGADKAWNYTRGLKPDGKPIVVAVVDSGIDINHPDLKQNIWVNAGEIPGNNIDDDNNGYIDDVNGYDVSTCAVFEPYQGDTCNTSKAPSPNVQDSFGHGTAMAGVIGAIGDTQGIIGTAPQVKIMPVKIAMPASGQGSDVDLAQGVIYAVKAGADIINLSYGSNLLIGEAHELSDQVVKYAYGLGVAIVAAAMNENSDVKDFSPANQPECITVAATDVDDQKAGFSNFGDRIDVAAPGVAIITLSANHGENSIAQSYASIPENADYLWASGTSLSAPYVSGVAALLLAQNPTRTIEQIRGILKISADDLGTPGRDPYFGSGRINAFRALGGQPLTVKISQPLTKSVLPLTGDLSIQGSAFGTNFASYQLFVLNNGAWQNIGSPISSPRTNSELGRLAVNNLLMGAYYIKLVALDSAGNAYEDIVVVYKEPAYGKIIESEIKLDPWGYVNKFLGADAQNVYWVYYQADSTFSANRFNLSSQRIDTPFSFSNCGLIENNFCINALSGLDLIGSKMLIQQNIDADSTVQLKMEDINTRELRVLSTTAEYYPDIQMKNGRISWKEFIYAIWPKMNLVVYDQQTNTKRTIVEYPSTGYVLMNDKIIWVDPIQNQLVSYSLTLNKIEPIVATGLDKIKTFYEMAADGDYVAIIVTGSNGLNNVAVLDLKNKSYKLLFNDRLENYAVKVSKGFVAVERYDHRANRTSVVVYDLAQNKLIMAAHDSQYPSRVMAMNENTLTWMDETGHLSYFTLPKNLPDLTIQSFTVTPSLLMAGGTATVQLSVANSGGALDQTVTVDVKIIKDTWQKNLTFTVPPLPAGANSALLSLPIILPTGGNYTLSAKVNPLNTITESNALNNGSSTLEYHVTTLNNAAIRGQLLDSKGLPVPGEIVVLSGSKYETDAQGKFNIPNLAPGAYSLKVFHNTDYQAISLNITTYEESYDLTWRPGVAASVLKQTPVLTPNPRSFSGAGASTPVGPTR